MLSRTLAALAARRSSLQNDEKEKGFTLIELLVVVIIIGVLAAIAIPVYLGIQNNARDSAVKSDLTNDKTAQVASYTNTPTAALLALDNSVAAEAALGVTKSANYATPGQVPKFFSGSTVLSFCIDAKSADTGKFFHVSSNQGVSAGACAAPTTATPW